MGDGVSRFKIGDRVGVPWLGWTCGTVRIARMARRISATMAKFTGYTLDGGYAEYTVADQRFCFPIPDSYSDAEAAPLLCAGLIGYRSLVKAGNGKRLGHLWFRRRRPYRRPGSEISAARDLRIHAGRVMKQHKQFRHESRRGLGRRFERIAAGKTRCRNHLRARRRVSSSSSASRRQRRHRRLRRHPHERHSVFPYSILWEERSICSVANLTRRDGEEFMALAPKVPVRTEVETFPLEEANEALHRLARRKDSGRGGAGNESGHGYTEESRW